MKAILGATATWLVASAVLSTLFASDGLGMALALFPAAIAYLRLSHEQRVEKIITGLNSIAENTDPVAATDPTTGNDILEGVLRCLHRETSEFGLESYEDFRLNWLTRSDVSVRNPTVMDGGCALFIMHADVLAEGDLPAVATAYGMGYGIGLAERASPMNLGHQVARQWQEVLGLIAALVNQNPPDPERPVPITVLLHATICGFYFGRTGHQPAQVQATIGRMREHS